MPSLSGSFDTRREAELAVERLVQQHGVHRDGITITPLSQENTVGVELAGSDAKRGEPQDSREEDAPLNGRILVALESGYEVLDTLREALEECGAQRVAVGEVS